MSRLDEKYEELIQRQIDGETSEQERTALRDFVAANAEAQTVQNRLLRLAEILNRVEEVEPPTDLSGNIMAALPAIGRSSTSAAPFQSRSGRLLSFFEYFKYGFALAAGILIGLVLGPAIFKQATTVNPAGLYGSMAPHATSSDLKPVDQIELNSDGLTGSVRLERQASRAVLEFDISSRTTTEVAVKFDADPVEFNGYNRESPGNISLATGNGQINLSCEGKQHFTLLLTNRKELPVDFNIEFFVSGKLVNAGTLRMP